MSPWLENFSPNPSNVHDIVSYIKTVLRSYLTRSHVFKVTQALSFEKNKSKEVVDREEIVNNG